MGQNFLDKHHKLRLLPLSVRTLIYKYKGPRCPQGDHYCMTKRSCPVSCSNFQYEMGQDFLDKQHKFALVAPLCKAPYI